MARRHAGKASPVVPRKTKAVTPESSLKERLAVLERERDALRAALEREESRARKLEQLNAVVRDRISWALDSLQAILDTKR